MAHRIVHGTVGFTTGIVGKNVSRLSGCLQQQHLQLHDSNTLKGRSIPACDLADRRAVGDGPVNVVGASVKQSADVNM